MLTRMFPLMFEDKELLMRTMWREQALFGNQINALNMMEAISLLFFKPGYTVLEVAEGMELQYYGIDEQLVWKSGISIPEAPNHHNQSFNANRIDLMRLLIVVLS